MAYSLHCHFSIPRKHCLNQTALTGPQLPPPQGVLNQVQLPLLLNPISFSLREHLPPTLTMNKNKQVFCSPSFLSLLEVSPRHSSKRWCCHGITTGPQWHSQNWNPAISAVESGAPCLKHWYSAGTCSIRPGLRACHCSHCTASAPSDEGPLMPGVLGMSSNTWHTSQNRGCHTAKCH